MDDELCSSSNLGYRIDHPSLLCSDIPMVFDSSHDHSLGRVRIRHSVLLSNLVGIYVERKKRRMVINKSYEKVMFVIYENTKQLGSGERNHRSVQNSLIE